MASGRHGTAWPHHHRVPAAVKRARILKEGSLTLIPYGMNDRLQWADRIANFTHQAR